MLKHINKGDVHRITSGQVIIDLLSIVKELVENSIDAHSDVIEFTFKDHGLLGVEINDNGSGINLQDYESLCLKHYTSKITKFEDLDLVKTLGFRGEALSSICAVADISILTSTAETFPASNELVYDSIGQLTSNTAVVNKRTEHGTKVSVDSLFKTLPVREKNFIKNIKKEFNKSINFLYNYVIIYPEIKFVVNNVIKGKKKNLISTTKTDSSLSNFMVIHGTKSAESLKPLSLTIEDDFKVDGFISSISIGKGRALKDKQYLYLNKRPIINKNILKIINETYNTFNNLQYPIFILNITITKDIDVNIAPSKVEVNFGKDLDEFKNHLVSFWEAENSGQQLKKESLEDISTQSVEQRYNKPITRPSSQFKPLVKPKRIRTVLEDDMFKTNNLRLKMKDTRIKFKLMKEKPVALKTEEDLVNKEIVVNKLDFSQMKLIGQFNLGFLLAKLDNNLFIVDQHASDEKFNYESLKNGFQVETQRLIKPIQLKLNLVERSKLVEYLPMIERNGFRINENYEVTHLPTYKGNQFDLNDLIELIDKVPEQTLLTKLASIFAMKACRKSIMIGQHLSVSTMKTILTNLSTLDKPWNCPHGRPTLRHLFDLTEASYKISDYSLH